MIEENYWYEELMNQGLIVNKLRKRPMKVLSMKERIIYFFFDLHNNITNLYWRLTWRLRKK